VIDEFILAACVPRAAHASGTLAAADAILAAHPEVAGGGIAPAALLGDADGVQRTLAEGASATAPSGPNGWDALTYLCFSQYLRLRGSDGFVRAAERLLDAGADANTGYFDAAHQPAPTFESALYGAAGVAHHSGLTRLLLARGADPNLGGEVAYHAAEGFDCEAMMAVVESGRLTGSGLTTMLHRKLDWTDLDGLRRLLEHGADPNAVSAWGDRGLDHALARGNALPLLEALLDHGADPGLPAPRHEGRSAVAVAARAGRVDALELFRRRGFDIRLEGDDAFFAALARGDRTIAADRGSVQRLAAERPGTVAVLAGAGNAPAVALALDLGFPLPADALAEAVWRERTDTVRLLLARGAPVTPEVLDLARRALTEHSDFTPHRSRAILDLLTSRSSG
jgi:Ankyrin repeats (many copies)